MILLIAMQMLAAGDCEPIREEYHAGSSDLTEAEIDKFFDVTPELKTGMCV